MDASRSLNIARRRFQNGNYMLSLKRYPAARKEFEVALSIFEKTDAYRETAEAMNNIGITYVKEGVPGEAKGFFERSYGLKKVHDEGGESLFNSLYNIVGLGNVLAPEEFEKYFLEMKALGGSLGGEYAGIVAREQQVYDKFVEVKEAEQKRQEAEALARTTPAGALAHLERLGKPCVIGLRFSLQGITVTVPEFSYDDGVKVRLAGITPGDGMSTGEIEFQADYDRVGEFLQKKEEPALLEEAFEHVKKFMEAVALVREDIDFCVGKRGYSVLSITLKNAFGEPLTIYHADATTPVAAVALTGEDAMLVGMMLSTKHGLYKMLLLNAKRSMAEENHSLSIVDAVAGFEAFMDLLLKKALPDAERKDYLSMENPCLRERLRFLKRLIGGTDASDSLEHYLGEVGRDMDDVLAYYDAIMGNDGHTIGAYESRKALVAVSRAIYNLKALYDI